MESICLLSTKASGQTSRISKKNLLELNNFKINPANDVVSGTDGDIITSNFLKINNFKIIKKLMHMSNILE